MTDLKKMFLGAALAIGFTPLLAQEPWDPHLKLTAGLMNNAESNYIGQNKVYGVTLAGAYPLFTIHGSGILEFGFKTFPTAAVSDGSLTFDDQTDVYFASAMYRHDLWRNGIYVQGGLRVTNAKTVRDMIYLGVGEKVTIKGSRETRAGWCFGAGYRLTDLWSFEVGASSAGLKNVGGKSVTGTIFEIALCIHR